MAGRYEITKFNMSNSILWKIKIQAILRKENCLATIGDRSSEFTSDEKWNEMNDNAVANLHLAIANEVLSNISEIKTTIIWDTLIKMYEVKSLHNKIFLKRRLYALRMAEYSSMVDHINCLNTLFAQLTFMGIEKTERAKLLLQSLPDSYDQFIINLTNNILTGFLNFDDVLTVVLVEERRHKNKEDKLASSKQAEALSMIIPESPSYSLHARSFYSSFQKTNDLGSVLGTNVP